jgi:AbrB family looped-hinge helix DNA binding protein
MPTATITSKGQVTIPKPVRDALRLAAGDRLEFALAADGGVRLEVRRRDARELAGLLHRPQGKRLTVAEMDAAIARAAAGKR